MTRRRQVKALAPVRVATTSLAFSKKRVAWPEAPLSSDSPSGRGCRVINRVNVVGLFCDV